MIRIEAPSRLHFGLLALPGAAAWPDMEGELTIPARHFGGAGLMLEQPGIALTVSPSAEWSAQGPSAERALSVAKAFCEGLDVHQTFAINVERCPPEHIGLGTGTQLSLAVARAIALATERADCPISELAKLIGRGRRSAIGIHGFAQGGFLVEAGKRDPEAISPLIARLPFPEDWSVLLVMPRSLQGDHGKRELEAFRNLARMPSMPSRTDCLSRLLLLGMLPAILEHDLEAFGENLYDFNRLVGEMYCTVQDGIYAHPQIEALVTFLRQNGVRGVGQSSWGPTVFAVVANGQADDLCNRLVRHQGIERNEIGVTRARNSGVTPVTA